MDSTRRRPWWAIVYALALLVITTVPYLVAWSAQTADWRYTGLIVGAEDGQSYLAKMRLGASGETNFSLSYTSEPHDSVPLVYLAYLLPGRIIGQFIPESSPSLTGALLIGFHAMRLGAAFLYLAVLYRFISAFVTTNALRLTAFVLATIGGGLGWLLLVGATNRLPPEFYLPEGFSLHLLIGLPHLLIARSALLGGLLLAFRAAENDRRQGWALGAAGCWAIMGLIVPFYLAVVYAVLAAWLVIAWVRLRAFPRRLFVTQLIGGGLTLPLFGYFLVVFSGNPAMAVWSAQNTLPSPPPIDYVLAYLPLLIPAVTALPFVWRAAWDKGRLTLLVGWVLVAPVLVYIPISVQRRLLEGFIIPLAILAAIGLAGWARHGRKGRYAAAAMVILSGLSAIFLLMGVIRAYKPDVPLYRPAAEATAFDWLNTHAPLNAVVLGSFQSGNVLPVYSRLRPFVGHGPETLAALEKEPLVEAFYRGELSAEEQATLLTGPCLAPATVGCSDPIDYVLFGPLEQALAGSATPGSWADGMTLVYDSDGYRVFAVRAAGN